MLPLLSSATTPGSENPTVVEALQVNSVMCASPFRVMLGVVVAVEVDETVWVTLTAVAALTFPAASVAVTERLLVLDAVSPTEADHSPEALAVLEAAEDPPATFTVELASAVPVTVIGLVLVEYGLEGKVTTGAEGATLS